VKRKRESTCKARQHSDQMLCECGLGWDMNDPDPPSCRKAAVGRQALESAREMLSSPMRLFERRKQLLSLQEMPLRWLPGDTLKAGLHTVTWASLPDASYVTIDLLRGREAELGRHYRFYSETGELLLEVRRVHTGQYQFLYRYPDGEWTHE
jgi:hypothetical protein